MITLAAPGQAVSGIRASTQSGPATVIGAGSLRPALSSTHICTPARLATGMGENSVVSVRLNVSTRNTLPTAIVPRSSKTASRFKGDIEQWMSRSPPFGTSLSPFLKQDKKGIAPISTYTYAKPIIPTFRALLRRMRNSTSHLLDHPARFRP